MEKLKILELFGGIGACSKALEKLKIEYEISDYVEIDKYAVKSFNAMHDTNFEPQDICKWDKNIDVDLIMHGSPCQDFSLAGKQAGGDEGSGTRSSLMYETIRIVEKLKPKYVIWENVKNVISKKHRHNFDNYLNKMEELGYKNYWQVLNAKDYGIPQNRERVFTVSILKNKIIYDDYNSNIRKDQTTIGTLTTNCGSSTIRNGWKIIEINSKFEFPKENIQECEVINPLQGISGKSWQFEQNVYSENSILRSLKAGGGSGNIPKVIENFEFPPKQELKLKLKDMLENKVDEKYYLRDSMINYLENGKYNSAKVSNKLKQTDTGICPTLDTMQGGNRQPFIKINNGTKKGYKEAYDGDSVNLSYPNSKTRRGRVGEQVSQTLQCNDTMGVVNSDLRIRKLTPKECWRLMGFDDEDFEKAKKVNSNTQLYKQAGNSIVVNVLMAIFKELLEIEEEENVK